MSDPLPIEAHLPEIEQALAEHSRLVLAAEPGAGKSTRVPLALLPSAWLGGRSIVLLEPRRVAARNLAHFLAASRGEPLGRTVGLRIRMEQHASEHTRLEVVTEGVLTRRLQADPELRDVGLIIFDEFHERSLHADLGLTLAREIQAGLRPDLRLLVMSATLEEERMRKHLDAPLIRVPGRQHPVSVRHEPATEPAAVAERIRGAAAEARGDVLVFMPGAREIRRCIDALAIRAPELEARPLYGALPLEEQQAALAPGSAERRRVVVATNIAESSLTVPGVRAVVDTGLAYEPVFDPGTGLTRLERRRIAQASAEQRAGRAGRLGPGLCLRLWSADERLRPAVPPEILQADLAPLRLELALWGADADQLDWLDAPPSGALAQAEELLQDLGLLDEQGRPSAAGRRAGTWGTHPRLAAMLEAADSDLPLAADLAALLEGRDPQAQGDDQVLSRLEALRSWRRSGKRPAPWSTVDRLARRWRRGGSAPQHDETPTTLGRLLLHAYPDRVAALRPGSRHRFRLASGGGAVLDERSELAGSRWLVVAELRHARPESRIRLAAPLDEKEWLAFAHPRSRWEQAVVWDREGERARALERRRYGDLVLEEVDQVKVDPEALAECLCEEVQRRGLDSLPWTSASRRLRQRVAFVRALEPESDWPDLSDEALARDLRSWLAPQLAGCSRWAELRRLDLRQVLASSLSYPMQQQLERLAPERIRVPSGREVAIDYEDPATPTLALKLQEMFGARVTPRIGNGRVPLTLQLLSPAGRPLQVTGDLEHFWKHGYPEVRKEMRGRYPKHPWPEDPVHAEATHLTKAAIRRRGGGPQ